MGVYSLSDKTIEKLAKKYSVKPGRIIKEFNKGNIKVVNKKIQVKNGTFKPPKTFKEKVKITWKIIKKTSKFSYIFFLLLSVAIALSLGYIIVNKDKIIYEKVSKLDIYHIIPSQNSFSIPSINGGVIQVLSPNEIKVNGLRINAEKILLNVSGGLLGEPKVDAYELINFDIQGSVDSKKLHIVGEDLKIDDLSAIKLKDKKDILKLTNNGAAIFKSLTYGKILSLKDVVIYNEGGESYDILAKWKGDKIVLNIKGNNVNFNSNDISVAKGKGSLDLNLSLDIDSPQNVEKYNGRALAKMENISLNITDMDEYIQKLYEGIVLKKQVNLEKVKKGYKIEVISDYDIKINKGIVSLKNIYLKSKKLYSTKNTLNYNLKTGYLNADFTVFPITESERFKALFGDYGMDIKIYGKIDNLNFSPKINKLKKNYQKHLKKMRIEEEIIKKMKKK